MTLIDPWFLLLKRLAYCKNIPKKGFFHCFFHFCSRSGQFRSPSVDFDRSVVSSPKAASNIQDSIRKVSSNPSFIPAAGQVSPDHHLLTLIDLWFLLLMRLAYYKNIHKKCLQLLLPFLLQVRSVQITFC